MSHHAPTTPLTSLALALLLLPPSSAIAAILAGPIISPVNGHTYYLLTQDTWTVSQFQARSLGGNLATIRSLAENNWIYHTFSGTPQAGRNLWIGLNNLDSPPQYTWISGEPFGSFTNWFPSEPNNFQTENFAFIHGPQFETESAASLWGDFKNNWLDYTNHNVDPRFRGTFYGVAEIIPEPSSLALLSLPALALLRLPRATSRSRRI